MQRPESQPEVWNQISDAYLRFVEPFLAQFSTYAIDRLLPQPDADLAALDVACGPGTLTLRLAEKVGAVTAIDFSEQMIARLKRRITERGTANVAAVVGDGQELPFVDDRFDLAASMFGLIFFPDRTRGFSELARVTKPGGAVCVGAWAPFERSELVSMVFRAVVPSFPILADAAPEPGLSDKALFLSELEDAGFVDIEIEEVTYSMTAPDADHFWIAVRSSFAGLVVFLENVDPDIIAEKEAEILSRLYDELGDRAVSLPSTAYLAFARVPNSQNR